jgi:hypothetical protein
MVVSQNQGKMVRLRVIRNHKSKLIEYTPGGRRQQSRLAAPVIFREHAERWTGWNDDSQMSWAWTAWSSLR